MREARIAIVAGTRPEAIKLAPLVAELRRRPGFGVTLIATGQHAMFAPTLAEFGLRSDIALDLPNAGLEQFCELLAAALPATLERLSPDLVLVQGDTSSAWVAARAARALGLSVGHVEAGLRSGDPLTPWPEERNRREIDAIADLLFAPCAAAVAELQGADGEIHLVGNTGIDALLAMVPPPSPRLHDGGLRQLLVTCHRREALAHLDGVALALRTLADRGDVRIVVPLHPNPAISRGLGDLLGGHPAIVTEPAHSYREMVLRLGAADLLLTDSGGLQEEAPALGLPTLVLRERTERPEPIASGNAVLVGLDPARIVAEATRLLDDAAAYAAMTRPSFPYGRGDASIRIADAIDRWCRQRPPKARLMASQQSMRLSSPPLLP